VCFLTRDLGYIQKRASTRRREEMEEERDWRGDLAREQGGFVLRVLKV